MKAKLVALGIAAFILTTNTYANEYNNYAGIQFTSLKLISTGIPTFNPTAIVARYGYELIPNLSLEGRVGTGLQSGRLNGPGGQITVDAGAFGGIYLKPHLELGSNFSIYAIAGASSLKGDATAILNGSSTSFALFSERHSSGSYGAGINIGKNGTAFNIEYMHYISKSDYEVVGYSVGMRFAF